MAVIEELLRAESDGTVSFGNYELAQKAKKENFVHGGDILKVKTFKDITKLECNDLFLYESVPGTTVSHFKEDAGGISFELEAAEDAQLTLGMEENKSYNVLVDDKSIGQMSTGVGGKLSFSVELTAGTPVRIRVEG